MRVQRPRADSGAQYLLSYSNTFENCSGIYVTVDSPVISYSNSPAFGYSRFVERDAAAEICPQPRWSDPGLRRHWPGTAACPGSMGTLQQPADGVRQSSYASGL